MYAVESSTSWEQVWERARPRWSLSVSERRLLLVTVDVLILGLAALAAIWGWSLMRPDIEFTLDFVLRVSPWPLILALAWIVLIALSGAYDLHTAARALDVGRRLVGATLALSLLYILIFILTSTRGAPGDPFAQLPWQLPRVIPALFLGVALVLSLAWRTLYALVLTGANFRRRVLVVGAGWAGRTIVGILTANLQSNYEIVGFIDDDPEKQKLTLLGVPVLGTSEDLLRVAQEQGVEELVLAITHGMQGQMFSAIMTCYAQGVALVPMPLLYEMATQRVPVEHVGTQWYVSLPTYTSARPRIADLLQRLGDIGLALLGLCVVAPLFPLIALILYLDSPGPILYSQTRMGKNGHPFRVHKFRSMVPDAESAGEAVWAKEEDPRITRFGKLMRKTRLDELPQLWNVLKGDMSLIGPRPERPEFITNLERQIPFYRTRLVVKPGLTGWAQVNYKYGNSVRDSLIKLQYDLYYIRHRSLWLNLYILLKTIGVVLRFEGT